MKNIDIKAIEKKGYELGTNIEKTWCPGCPDRMVHESCRRALLSLIKQGYKKISFVMATDIGCQGKIYDYLDISAFYGLHGRVIPTAVGIKIGNPNLNVLAFAGDGGAYTEGIAHFVSACRTNPNITLIVNDNQSFSLTTGQATATSQEGFKTKAEPLGANAPMNPILVALSIGAGFVARCNARDIDHTARVIEEAIKYNGFSYIEIIQDCLVYNPVMNNRDSRMYKITPKNFDEALVLAREYDYNLGEGKIPIGIFYKKEKRSMEDRWPQLVNLKKIKKGWKGLKK